MTRQENSFVVFDTVVRLSGWKFLAGCAGFSLFMILAGRLVTIPPWLLALEVFGTVLSLFLLGSFKYRLDKNALTYGSGMLALATFLAAWWGAHKRRGVITNEEVAAWWPVLRDWLFSFKGPDGHQGLDGLIHLDTMLFILGLTLFVSVIAQTRLLEGITFFLLRRNRGRVLPTVIAVTAAVSFASGILDGVSMIGLSIRTLVIILMLASTPLGAVRYAVMACTVVTTACGMWLAYGEPPNLIMKANLVSSEGASYLTDGFFLRYCLPAAVISYLCLALNFRKKLHGLKVDLAGLDVLDSNASTVRFLQASRHGEVFTPVEFVEDHAADLAGAFDSVRDRVRKGEPMGLALVREQVGPDLRQQLLGRYVAEELAAKLDRHYELEAAGRSPEIDEGEAAVQQALDRLRHRRVLAQRIGAFALIPFVGLLAAHAINHNVPLYWASFAGFAAALAGIYSLPKMRNLALREARHEYTEYLFLFPLFLSITLLTEIGFFSGLQAALREGIASAGYTAMAITQFWGATGLSAFLDNNVVADFASRALYGLPEAAIHLFAMAQIAGYAAGGCWTHIGSAQSVVAFAFIRRDVDEHYTPMQWIKEMTPLLVSIAVSLTVLIAAEGVLMKWLK